jgi:hypothetical protein
LDEVVLLEIAVGVNGDGEVGSVPGQIGDTVHWRVAEHLITDTAVGVARAIKRKTALHEIIVVLLIGGIGAKGVVVRQTGQAHDIRAVDAELDGGGIGHGDFKPAEDGAAEHLAVGELRVQINAGLVMPKAIGWNIDVIIVGVGIA